MCMILYRKGGEMGNFMGGAGGGGGGGRVKMEGG